MNSDSVISMHTVISMTGISRTTIWRRERAGDFPKRIQLSPGRVGWKAVEIQAWIEDRPCVEGGGRDGA